jgi:hypothetical protein
MSETIKFNYNQNSIRFEFKDGNRMINATEMAKPFGKRVGDFLRLDGTKLYVELLEKRYVDSLNVDNQQVNKEVLRIVKGGTDAQLQGTWMDEKLALKFAAWLSAEFELWVYDRIQELLLTGITELKSTAPEGFATTLRLLADKFEEQEKVNTNHNQRITEIEAKILSSDENYYTIAGYCSKNRIDCPLQKAKIWGKLATSLSREMNHETGVAHDERYGQVRTYHVNVLEKAIK